MIDEKKLIEELKFQINNCETYGHSDIYIDLEMAKKWVETIEKKKVGEWIPVEERLPKHYGQYLITAINDYEGIYMAVSNYDSQYKSFSSDGVEDDNAIAWMDLPKMYEVKE